VYEIFRGSVNNGTVLKAYLLKFKYIFFLLIVNYNVLQGTRIVQMYQVPMVTRQSTEAAQYLTSITVEFPF
jgi:hypothetical protein